MEIRHYRHYSGHLQREMEFNIYGHAGRPVLFIPCQAGRFWDFDAFGMIHTWGKWIEEGLVTVYSCDTIDTETYANPGGDPAWRTQQHERWYRYIVDELVPTINHLDWERNQRRGLIMAFGCSLGAMHAANLFFRRPDLFGSVLALSGLYDPDSYFGGYMDETLYNNSPNLFLANMPNDHYYIDMYNHRKMVFCVGQGAWEDVGIESTSRLSQILQSKGINAQVDFWGHDVNHDWDWWFKQVDHYVPQFLY